MVLEPVLELALVEQAGLELIEIHLPPPPGMKTSTYINKQVKLCLFWSYYKKNGRVPRDNPCESDVHNFSAVLFFSFRAHLFPDGSVFQFMSSLGFHLFFSTLFFLLLSFVDF